MMSRSQRCVTSPAMLGRNGRIVLEVTRAYTHENCTAAAVSRLLVLMQPPTQPSSSPCHCVRAIALHTFFPRRPVSVPRPTTQLSILTPLRFASTHCGDHLSQSQRTHQFALPICLCACRWRHSTVRPEIALPVTFSAVVASHLGAALSPCPFDLRTWELCDHSKLAPSQPIAALCSRTIFIGQRKQGQDANVIR